MPTGSPPGSVPTDIQGRVKGTPGGASRPSIFGGGPSSPGAPGGAPGPQLGRELSLPPFHQVKPPQAQDFYWSQSATGLNVGNTPAVIPGSSFQIPGNSVGVVRSISIGVNFMLVSTNILFRLRLDQVPVPGWDLLRIFPRGAASVVDSYGPNETFILIGDGQLVDIEVQVLDAGTYQIGTILHGWYYPTRLQDILEATYQL